MAQSNRQYGAGGGNPSGGGQKGQIKEQTKQFMK